jgi:hypothetical protein
MRIGFPTLIRPKNAAKILSRQTGLALSRCQAAIARGCGYRDWHDLERSKTEESTPDQRLSRDNFVDRQVTLTLQIADALGIDHGEVQFALSTARLTGDRVSHVSEQLDIRAGCYRRTSLPETGRRQRGSIGKVKSPGWNSEIVILKKFGRPTDIITHKSPNSGVADFEYQAPRQSLPLFIPMRLYLVYGSWTERDGSVVLYSRDYLPLWRLREGKKPERANPWEWIRFDHQRGFWDDSNTPWRCPSRHNEELARIAAYGICGLPLLVEALP